MNECGRCGDRYPDTAVHNCWVLLKLRTQEDLPEPSPVDYAPMGRPIETDAEWEANRRGQ